MLYTFRKWYKENVHAGKWLKIAFLLLHRNKELAQAFVVDGMSCSLSLS